MTRSEFAELCGELLIDITIALESEAVQAALLRRATTQEIRKILLNEF